MRVENQPDVEYRLVLIKRPAGRGTVARLRVLLRGEESHTLDSWEWPSGRPTPAQAQDMVARLVDEVGADIVTRIGLQETLL